VIPAARTTKERSAQGRRHLPAPHESGTGATKVLHRKPGASGWEIVELDWAMDRVAELIKETRDETFIDSLPTASS